MSKHYSMVTQYAEDGRALHYCMGRMNAQYFLTEALMDCYQAPESTILGWKDHNKMVQCPEVHTVSISGMGPDGDGLFLCPNHYLAFMVAVGWEHGPDAEIAHNLGDDYPWALFLLRVKDEVEKATGW